MPLSFAVSDFVTSILSHVARGFAGAVFACIVIALSRAMIIGSFTSTYRR
jgi:hypothetical protein